MGRMRSIYKFPPPPPPPPPERSKRLHNFTLPYLRWGQQRFLRCVKLPSSSSSSPSADRANHGSPATLNEAILVWFQTKIPFTTISHHVYSFISLGKTDHHDLCGVKSPARISFAGDLGQSDKALTIEQQQPSSGLVRRDTTLLDSEFEFHTSRSFDSSPADEIFADRMILPFQVTTASSMPKRRHNYELPPIISTPSSSIPPPPRHCHHPNSRENTVRRKLPESETVVGGAHIHTRRQKHHQSRFGAVGDGLHPSTGPSNNRP
ncbi:hypothetical protein F2Q70_00022607 [Brassica cretica]|uniref:Uncharacterized protein n=1 Tax=Brassica cretica TaxID=69181 RepID=A0A8S9GQM0_BRACR|nr:hypothetical protein F2Q70_00022607 [Brassica cretica]